MTRRKFALLSGAAVVGGYGGIKLQKTAEAAEAFRWAGGKIGRRDYPGALLFRRPGRAACSKASGNAAWTCAAKRVLLKPNLVEFDPATVINTNAAVIAAAVEVFQRLGAAEVKIGEGPGHRRDTLDMADDARYRATIPKFESIFTDLNRDDVSPVTRLRRASRNSISRTPCWART